MSVSLPNTQPIYTRTPATGFVVLTNQVANRSPATANLPLLFEAGAAGALVENIRVVFLGNEATARDVRLYRKKSTQVTAALVSYISTGVISNIDQATQWVDMPLMPVLLGTSKTALRLEPYENLYVALSGTLTNGVNVFAIGGQYE